VGRFKKAFNIFLYSIFFLGLFFVSIYFTFPINQLKDLVVREIENLMNRSDPGNWIIKPKVEISNIALWRLSGIKLSKVFIQPGSDNTFAQPWQIDALRLRLGIFGALIGGPDIEYDIDLYGGEAYGFVSLSKETRIVDASLTIDQLDLGKLPFFSGFSEFPIAGKMDIDGNVKIQKGLHENGTGSLIVNLDNIVLGPGKIDLPSMGFSEGFSAPKVNLGKFSTTINIAEGKGKSKEFKLSGGDVQLESDLEIAFSRSLTASKLKGEGWFKISDQFLEANSVVKTLLDFNPKLKNSKDVEGKIPFKLLGTLSSPRPQLG
jgi:type II secretion system protein N